MSTKYTPPIRDEAFLEFVDMLDNEERILGMDDAIKLLEESIDYMWHSSSCDKKAVSAKGGGGCQCGFIGLLSRIDALLATGGWVPVEEDKYISAFSCVKPDDTVYTRIKGLWYTFTLPPLPKEPTK